jgi:predicted Zn finger-like uncharacterized protein
MQFSCESCKTALQIADEKVRGKRLIVRCKRCGSKITISDPALAGGASPPIAAPAPRAPTLQRPAAAASLDPPIWFAMLGGQQTGPLTGAQVEIKIAEGAVGPRTYMWKDGMASWQRAKDVADVSVMFGRPPEPPRTTAAPPRTTATPPVPSVGFREFSTADFGNTDLGTGEQKLVENADPEFSTGDFGGIGAKRDGSRPRRSAEPQAKDRQERLAPPAAERAPAEMGSHDGEDLATVDPLPLGERVHQEGIAKELFHTGSLETAGQSALDLALLSDKPAKKRRDSGPAAPKVPQPPPAPRASRLRKELIFASGAPTLANRGPLVAAIAFCVLAALVVLLWSLVRSGSERRAQETPAAQKRAARAAAAAAKAEAQQSKARPPPEKPTPATAPAEPAAAKSSGLTSGQVRRKLNESKGALQGCVDQALRLDPNLQVGRILITTRIAPTGQVTAAKIDKSAVDGSPLGACLKRATRRIVFPSFTGDPFEVQIPIVVTARE